MVALLAVVGCGADSPPNESQVAVKINDGEISIHQVQAVLRRQPGLAKFASEQTASSVLEVLVDQELAAQAASAQGLDKSAEVLQALQLSRREVLARAYHDRIAEGATGPSSADIDRYYDSHPALFAERRLYLLQEIAVEASEAQMASLRTALSAARGADAAKSHVERLDLGFRSANSHNLPRMFRCCCSGSLAKPGDSLLFEQKGGARIFTVVNAHPAPVDRRIAAGRIGRSCWSRNSGVNWWASPCRCCARRRSCSTWATSPDWRRWRLASTDNVTGDAAVTVTLRRRLSGFRTHRLDGIHPARFNSWRAAALLASRCCSCRCSGISPLARGRTACRDMSRRSLPCPRSCCIASAPRSHRFPSASSADRSGLASRARVRAVCAWPRV